VFSCFRVGGLNSSTKKIRGVKVRILGHASPEQSQQILAKAANHKKAACSRAATLMLYNRTAMNPARPINGISRRTFVARFSATAAGACVNLRPQMAFASSGPSIAFPTAPRDRLAVASYPFRAYIESPANRDRDRSLAGMDLTQFPAEVVRKFNVHNIEPHSRHFRSLDADYLGGFRSALEKANAKVVNIAVDGPDSFYDADAAVRNKAIAYGKTWVDVAIQIGSPSIRVHVQRAKNSEPNIERLANSLRELTNYAAEKNVVVNLENDDLVSEDAFFLVKTIEAVNSSFLHALPDFANSMLTGDADFNYRALTAMSEHAYCICHVKDGEAGDNGKQFSVDLKKSFDILKASGYRGYCSMEFDAAGDPYAPTAKLIEQSIRYLS
jgi:sugar phosphate isomerase/epimerase